MKKSEEQFENATENQQQTAGAQSPENEAAGRKGSGTADEQARSTDEEAAQETSAASPDGTDSARIEALENELQQQKDKYIRLMAEFDNFKRRTSREYERMVESANEKLMLEIIEVRENFDRALATGHDVDQAAFYDGIKLIYARLDDILKRNGLRVFTEVGDEFDPELHDAMMKMPHEEIPEDHVVDIYEKGYRLKERVIKHAKVVVSSGAAAGEQEAGEKDE
jgi:molecular chaperone GrpE